MEASLLTRCFLSLVCVSVFFDYGAAVSQPKKPSAAINAGQGISKTDRESPRGVSSLTREEGHTEGHVNEHGIYTQSRKVVLTDPEDEPSPQRIEQPAFFRREVNHDGEPSKDGKHVVRDSVEESAALAEAEAFSVAELDESFIWWDRRRRRRRYNCKWGQWEAWKACTVECGAGQKQRDRVTDGPHWGGNKCSGAKSEFETCNTHGCKVDCNWAHWGPWGPCSKTCGFGLQVRQRGILPYTDMDGGKDCDDAQRKSSQECNRFSCPMPCTFKEWGLWGGCSQTCGAGLKRRTRETNPAQHGGSPCLGELFTDEKCNNFVCPIDCAWAAWGGWGKCSRTCGGGIRLRERAYANQMENGGVHCPGSPAEVIACNLEECPVDCKWAPWHDPGPCTKTCGGGSFMRHRAKITYEKFNGKPCTGPNTEIGPCNVEPCAIDCLYSDWAPWSECSASCGGGVHQTTRNGTEPFHGGAECYAANKTKEEECNTDECSAMEVKAAAWQQASYSFVVVMLLASSMLL